MPKFGRVVCVLIPFLLTLASLIAMLLAGLACIADKSLYMFEVNLASLSISPVSVTEIASGAGLSSGKNLNAADLGLYNAYRVGVWTFCYTGQDGIDNCIKPAFGWADRALNITTTRSGLNSFLTSTGLNVTLPQDISVAVKALGMVNKGSEAAFLVAYIMLGIELFFGFWANYSRILSCVTWLVAFIAVIAVVAAAAAATAISAVVVGAVEAVSLLYSVEAHFNTRFLVTLWIGVAFAMAASIFWLFTVCCCAPSRRRSRHHADDLEKPQAPAPPASLPSLEGAVEPKEAVRLSVKEPAKDNVEHA